MTFKQTCEDLQEQIKQTYESSVSLEEAEKLAGRFLYAQLLVSEQLKSSSLDSRMRKSGLKSLKAALYLNEVQNQLKKPTEATLTALIDSNKLVGDEQLSLDSSEVNTEELERLYDIFLNAHIYFRGIAKGSFNG